MQGVENLPVFRRPDEALALRAQLPHGRGRRDPDGKDPAAGIAPKPPGLTGPGFRQRARPTAFPVKEGPIPADNRGETVGEG